MVISTIQRVHSPVLDGGHRRDDPQLRDAFTPDAPVVDYSPTCRSFGLVIVDGRTARSTASGAASWSTSTPTSSGATATPGRQTFAFFRQNLVSEYTYPRSVYADRVNVDFDIYRISTEISEQGSMIEAGTVVPKVDQRTTKERLEDPHRRP